MKQSFSVVLLGKAFLMGFALLLGLVYAAAWAVERGSMSFALGQAALPGLVVLAAFASSWYCAGKSGSGRAGLITASFAGGLLALCAFIRFGMNGQYITLLKELLGLVLGTVLGNFAGLRQYYSLRNPAKHRRKSTK